ncbi:glycosyltransferase family 22 protein [Crepidotus variabilis]|uniref:Mannosyltransferase n=1 Tax=Crepidotus variabilis TaxID=179855 RepID=A0A9P6JWX2_9AGAR|nr:glycosyltransferase family 22 protein [Crepidotus variabilis]
MSQNIEYLRFSKPKQPDEDFKPKPRHTGILQDQLRRAQRRPWTPSFSVAFRVILLVRFAAAMYSNINDCDEVFNFWEPLHFLDQGHGFQTWELSPKYALRSWAYILLHWIPARFGRIFVPGDKRPSFFAVRVFLALISTLVESAFYVTIQQKINERVGRYYFFLTLFSAGFWNASTAFLPTSFAMFTTTLACSYAFEPSSSANKRRTLATTLLFATGAIVGWPFSLLLAIPFVFEELFVYGTDIVTPQQRVSWTITRVQRLVTAGLKASLIFIPVIAIDSIAYGKFTITPWNIVRYNLLGGSERGPNLYGTEPWYFYINNLILNFNFSVPLALISLPALAITYVIDRKRLGLFTPTANQSSPFTLLAMRLLPFYLWLTVLSFQPHKEERFMYPAYPLLCFNAAVAIYLLRGWLEVAYISATRSPYRASQAKMFSNFTFSILIACSIFSFSRIVALWYYYHNTLVVPIHFQMNEIPRLLNETGYLPVYPPGTPDDEIPHMDISPIRDFDLRLCVAKEWYRFPGHYLIPNGIRVDFVKSEFNGMLPRHFEDKVGLIEGEKSVADASFDGQIVTFSQKWWRRPETRLVPGDLNDKNEEEPSHYVLASDCDYLVDLDFPQHPESTELEPRYATMENTWERIACYPFLDARHSETLTRAFWVPGQKWRSLNEFGDYCLLKNKKLVAEKENEARRNAENVY